MGSVTSWEDAIREGNYRAQERVAGYIGDYSDAVRNPRVTASVERALRILDAARAPLVVVGDVVDMVTFTEVARLRMDQPPLTNFELIDIIRDVWIRVKDWIVND